MDDSENSLYLIGSVVNKAIEAAELRKRVAQVEAGNLALQESLEAAAQERDKANAALEIAHRDLEGFRAEREGIHAELEAARAELAAARLEAARTGPAAAPFARGGILERPPLVGREGPAEAVIPLPDGRRIPVELSIPRDGYIRRRAQAVEDLEAAAARVEGLEAEAAEELEGEPWPAPAPADG
jgi:hypothetical protein